MATIKDTKLEVGNVSGQPGKSRVTVTSVLSFTAEDAGNWKYAIRLYADDTNEPATGNALLYTFLFPSRPYRQINAQPGEVTIKEERIVDANLLDEDPGFVTIAPLTFKLPRKDEVYALADLTRSKVSNTWTSFGV